MKKLLSIFLFCSLLIIATFLLFSDVEKWVEINLNSSKTLWAYTLLSFGFLTADIILPIPSSLVMILNGKILGVFFGTAISLLSGLSGSSIGFYLGRKSNPYFDRFFSEQDKVYGNQLFEKFGNTAIAISKSLPIISETISFISGTTAISYKRFMLFSAVGHFIVSLVYASVGVFAASLNSYLVTVVVVLLALMFAWILQWTLKSKNI